MNSKELKYRIHTIIFEAETPAGKAFDIALLFAIVASVVVVVLESVSELDVKFHRLFFILEWVFTILFTIEYALRIYSLKKPKSYIFSFYGLIDLLSILPTFLALVVAGSQMLMTIRILRLLRVFRVLKLTRYVSEGTTLSRALLASRRKIMMFLYVVIMITIIAGTIMYLVEGPESGFTSIPVSIYWTIVTLTTVGFGDITPMTPIGQAIASCIMILGYGIIAVPTGIVTSELTRVKNDVNLTESCRECGTEGHKKGARFCYNCGSELNKY
jgi:voltage-gated potassium channel